MENSRHYFFCGSKRNLERHHAFFGARRRLSERYGMVVDLCMEHHRGRKGPHMDRESDLIIKLYCQQKFEESHTRKEFIRIFGRSYL